MKTNRNRFLDDWILTKNIPLASRKAYVVINFWRPGIKELTKIKIEERKEFSNSFLTASLKNILDSNLVEQIEISGTRKRPFGITGKTSLYNYSKLSRLKFVDNIFIKRMDGAKKRKSKKIKKLRLYFYCVKMTVSIQIEGFTSGMQLCED